MNYKVSKNGGVEVEGSGSDPCLGLFAKLRKVTISFVMRVLLSVRMEYLCFHRTDFHEIVYLSILKNLSRNSSFIKI